MPPSKAMVAFNMMGIWCLSFAILFSRYGGCARLVLVCSSCNETLKLILVSIGGIILLARITVNQWILGATTNTESRRWSITRMQLFWDKKWGAIFQLKFTLARLDYCSPSERSRPHAASWLSSCLFALASSFLWPANREFQWDSGPPDGCVSEYVFRKALVLQSGHA
jgi:hypothetical protein